MHLLELSDAATFLERSREFLLSAEAENNLLLSSALTLARNSARSPRLSFFVVQQAGRVICAALNSSERRLLLSMASDGASRFMGQELAKRDARIKGVLGPDEATQAFCAAFATETHQTLAPRHEQRILRLETPIERPTVSGRMRAAGPKDRKLLMKWSHQFVQECGLDEKVEETEEMVHRYLENRQLFIWDEGRPVAMAGFGGVTPNGVRVNMVYTEPALRGRGYAGSLVYVLSRKLLAEGHRFCFLFTDAANPVANRVYEKLGYRAICSFTEYRPVTPQDSTSE